MKPVIEAGDSSMMKEEKAQLSKRSELSLLQLQLTQQPQDGSVVAASAVGTGPVSGSDSSDPVAAPLTKKNLSDMKGEQKRFLQ